MHKKIALLPTVLLSIVLLISMISFVTSLGMIEGQSTHEYVSMTNSEYHNKTLEDEFDDEDIININNEIERSWYDHERLNENTNVIFKSNDYYHYSVGAIKPSPPRNATIDFDGMRVQIVWDLPSDNGTKDIIGYRVYKGINYSNYTLLSELKADDIEYLDFNFTRGINNSYYVVAFNQEGEGNRTAILNIKPTNPPSPPINVVLYQAANGVSVSWDPPVSEENIPVVLYRINRQVEGSSDIFWIASSTLTIYLDTNIVSNTTYHYYIFAVNDVGVSNSSQKVSIDIGDLSTQDDPETMNNDEEKYPIGIMVFVVIFLIIIGSILAALVLLKKHNLADISSEEENPPHD